MKKISLLLLTLLLSSASFAQHRYHIENVTDYSAVSTPKSERPQHRIGIAATAPLKSFGSPNVPVILVQFPDLMFSCDTIMNKEIEHSDENVRLFYDRFCNGSGDPDEDYRFTIGSVSYVSQYFNTCSDGQFTPHFGVIGPVTLPRSFKYYGEDTNDNMKDRNMTAFYRDALKLALLQGADMSSFDNNGDGKIDFVFFIYAGEGQNAYGKKSECEGDESYYIWPKELQDDFTINSTDSLDQPVQYVFGGYGCTNEIYKGGVDGIGTMCHELSHGLGLPDLYDTNYVGFGMDYFDVMDSGNYCMVGRSPVEYSAYERDFMGWRKMETVDLSKQQTITIKPIEDGGKGYKLINPNNKNEYYILENRQQIGFDHYFGYVASQYLRDFGEISGLLVTHLDYNLDSWQQNRVNTTIHHQRLTVLPADGELITSIRGYTDEYFTSLRNDLYPGGMNVTSIPSDRFTLFSGGTLPVNITDIRQNDDLTVSVDFNGGEPNDIEDITSEGGINGNGSTYYDLMGRKVGNPSKGVYIKGGKKVFVK